MIGSSELEEEIERNIEERRAFIKQWAAYVREHDEIDPQSSHWTRRCLS